MKIQWDHERMLQSPEGDWADCDALEPGRNTCTTGSSCNPLKGIGLIATPLIPLSGP